MERDDLYQKRLGSVDKERSVICNFGIGGQSRI